MAARIISLKQATSPEFTDRQKEFCRELVGIGLARLTIASLVMDVDSSKLNHAQISAANRLINQSYKQLGYNITDARHAQSPFTAQAVKIAAKSHAVKVRFA